MNIAVNASKDIARLIRISGQVRILRADTGVSSGSAVILGKKNQINNAMHAQTAPPAANAIRHPNWAASIVVTGEPTTLATATPENTVAIALPALAGPAIFAAVDVAMLQYTGSANAESTRPTARKA